MPFSSKAQICIIIINTLAFSNFIIPYRAKAENINDFILTQSGFHRGYTKFGKKSHIKLQKDSSVL